MQDSVILANCLYDLKSLSYESVVEALEDFKDQRFDNAKEQFKTSRVNAIFLHGQVMKHDQYCRQSTKSRKKMN